MIKRLGRRTVYENRWMKVHEDAVRFPDGLEGVYGVVDKEDFALIVPLHSDGQFQLVQQFRYPVGERFWEFPQGSWETRPGADPLDVARGELEEETGFRAGSLQEIGFLYEAYGFSNQGFHIFLATDLHPGSALRDPEEQDLITRKFSLDQIKEMILSGQIRDAPSVSAITVLILSGTLDQSAPRGKTE